MAHSYLQLKSVHKTTGYSHAARVGNLLVISGQVALDKNGKLVGRGDITAQTKQVYANIGNILKEAGGSFANVVKFGVFLTHHRFLEPYRAVRTSVLGNLMPTSTLLVVESLADPDWLIEVETIAELDK